MMKTLAIFLAIVITVFLRQDSRHIQNSIHETLNVLK
jgi:pyridoxine 5'-phosphate synthase PdxJ